MTPKHDAIVLKYNGFKKKVNTVHHLLEKAIENLKNKGCFNFESDEFKNAVDEFKAERKVLCELIETTFDSFAAKVPNKFPTIDPAQISYKFIDEALKAIRENEEKENQVNNFFVQLMAVVNDILSIRHKTSENFHPLDELHNRARKHKNELEYAYQNDKFRRDMLSFDHVLYGAIIGLIREGQTLSDDIWNEFAELVTTKCGKELKTAILRGNLQITNQDTLSVADVVKAPAVVDSVVEEGKKLQQIIASGVASRHYQSDKTAGLNYKAPKERHEESSQPETPSEKVPEKKSDAPGDDGLKTPPDNVEAINIKEPEIVSATETVEIVETKEETFQAAENTPLGEAVRPSENKKPEHDTLPHPEITRQTDSNKSFPQVGSAEEEKSPADNAQILPVAGGSQEFQKSPENDFDADGTAWRLIGEDKLSLAFLCKEYCSDKSAEEALGRLDPCLVKFLLLGMRVRREAGEIAGEIVPLVEYFIGKKSFEPADTRYSKAVKMLSLASTLIPTLLAPGTNAFIYLQQVLDELRPRHNEFRSFYDYCLLVCDFGGKQNALEPELLKTIKDEATWKSELASLQKDIKTWFQQARSRNIYSHRGFLIWQEFLKQGRFMHAVYKVIANNEVSKLQYVHKTISELNRRTVDSLVDDYDNMLNCTVNELNKTAYEQIYNQVSVLKDFGEQWIMLQRSNPGRARGHIEKTAETLKTDLGRLYSGAVSELGELLSCGFGPLAAAARHCWKALEFIKGLFDAGVPFKYDEPQIKQILYPELLKTSAAIDIDWRPTGDCGAELRESLISVIEDASYSWEKAFENRCRSKEHNVTGYMLEYFDGPDRPAPEIGQKERDALNRRREEKIVQCRDLTAREVENIRRRIDIATAYGFINEFERNDNIFKLDSIEKELAANFDFRELSRKISEISSFLAGNQNRAIECVRAVLEKMVPKDNAYYSKILAVLESGDVFTANEYIELIRKNQESDIDLMDDSRDFFREFFPEKVRALYRMISEEPVPRIISRIKHREQDGVLNMKSVSNREAERSSEMMKVWFEFKRVKKIWSEPLLKSIFEWLNFKSVSLSHPISPNAESIWYNLKTAPVQDKNSCPIPVYGSQARGNYKLFCTWQRSVEESLIKDIGETSYSTPTIVLYFGCLTDHTRIQISRLSREHKKTFIVIDDILMVYLCSERELRMRIMYECTIPFTFIAPYTPTGVVAPEMFYGRSHEINEVMRQGGTSFIYGGRQLGKTALMKEAARRFNDSESTGAAIYIDLDMHEIGLNQPNPKLWPLLADEFKTRKIIPDSSPSNVGPEKIIDYIKSWLSEKDTRRLLLLLDEADRFLERDSKDDFVIVSKFKGLMTETDYRFKVVFAGLHNVQRTTRVANHSLAHLGAPICIGPLIDKECREAIALIQKPLSCLGYRFSSRDLIFRILSQTNYYPNLIQLYCSHLLQHVNKLMMTRDQTYYQINNNNIHETYKDEELRQHIRARFMWTIQLDMRYEVIAYTIAYGTLTEKTELILEGFPEEWIRREATKYWAEGFTGSSTAGAFGALLDEMAGLGVLRKVSYGKYALRSPNVTLLMGTENELLEGLMRHREKSPEYDPTTFRSAFRDASKSLIKQRRHPLTVHQEFSLLNEKGNKTFVVFGCKSSGLDELSEFIENGTDKEFFVRSAATDKKKFETELNSLKDREKHGISIFLVNDQMPWNKDWVTMAAHKTRNLKSTNSYAHVVFLANPLHAWDMAAGDFEALDEFTKCGVSIMDLELWKDGAYLQWLEAVELAYLNEVARNRIVDATGRWHSFFNRFNDKIGMKKNAKAPKRELEFYLEEYEKSIFTAENARKIIVDEFGINYGEQRKILNCISLFSEIPPTICDLEEMIKPEDGIDKKSVARVVKWAEMFNFIGPASTDLTGTGVRENHWAVNNLLGRLLNCAGEF